MHRSRIRSIAFGAIVALGLLGMGAGCALDEGLDEASPDQAGLDETQLDEAGLQAAVDQDAVPQAPDLDEVLAADPSAPKDLEEVWPGSPRAQELQALAGGWGRICSPDGNAGLYNGALGWHCPGRFLQNLNNGHRIKASLICGGNPPV